MENRYWWRLGTGGDKVHNVKFLNFRMIEKFAVTDLKFNQRGKTIGYI